MKDLRIVSLESPYHSEDPATLNRNIGYAIQASKHSLSLNEVPYPSHLMYTTAFEMNLADHEKPSLRRHTLCVDAPMPLSYIAISGCHRRCERMQHTDRVSQLTGQLYDVRKDYSLKYFMNKCHGCGRALIDESYTYVYYRPSAYCFDCYQIMKDGKLGIKYARINSLICLHEGCTDFTQLYVCKQYCNRHISSKTESSLCKRCGEDKKCNDEFCNHCAVVLFNKEVQAYRALGSVQELQDYKDLGSYERLCRDDITQHADELGIN